MTHNHVPHWTTRVAEQGKSVDEWLGWAFEFIARPEVADLLTAKLGPVPRDNHYKTYAATGERIAYVANAWLDFGPGVNEKNLISQLKNC